MARYLIHIDMPIAVTLRCGDTPQLEFEQWPGAPLEWVKTGEQTVDGIRRLYYAACAPHRVLLVMRGGQDARSLNASPGNTYATALVGWDEGTAGYVRPGEEGRRHTKISIDVIHTLMPDYAAANVRQHGIELISWSALLAKAPRSDQRGGYRGTQGRQRIDQDEPTSRISASVPTSYVDALRKLGSGDISLGVRRAIEAAAPPRSETVTIASRKVTEHQVQPPLVEIDGKTYVEMGSGLLADVLAAGVESGAIPGQALRRGDTIYYWHEAGYESLTAIVMMRP